MLPFCCFQACKRNTLAARAHKTFRIIILHIPGNKGMTQIWGVLHFTGFHHVEMYMLWACHNLLFFCRATENRQLLAMMLIMLFNISIIKRSTSDEHDLFIHAAVTKISGKLPLLVTDDMLHPILTNASFINWAYKLLNFQPYSP